MTRSKGVTGLSGDDGLDHNGTEELGEAPALKRAKTGRRARHGFSWALELKRLELPA
jgi:hypothetical protein